MATFKNDPPSLHLSLVEWSALQRIDHACAELRALHVPEETVRRAWVAGALHNFGDDIVKQLDGRSITVLVEGLNVEGARVGALDS